MNANPAIAFRCNICGADCLVPEERLQREVASCACGSSLRSRAIVHLLSLGLFGRSLALSEFPRDKSIRGLGMSDWDGYARPLAERLGYRNTWYHQEPRLDITQVSDEQAGSCDFLISSDVFEHVAPPVARAFEGARKLLRAGGVFVLTVPFDHAAAQTVEHFPDLHRFRIVEEDGNLRLYNERSDGRTEVFDDLVFHGGPGSTLEMRLFSQAALLRHCQEAGFRDARVVAEDVPQWGIRWRHPWSLPILAIA